MQKGLWLRFDIPYSEDAVKMRAELANRDDDGGIKLFTLTDCPNIPEAVKMIYEKASGAGIILDTTLVFVYPLDARHALAWPVKDEADKRGVIYARNIPDILKLPSDLPSAYDNFDTGSAEDTFTGVEAVNKIRALNSEADGLAGGGELLEAMGPIRHALWMSVRHFGWSDPLTVYTLLKLGYVMKATGNNENIEEALYLISKFIYFSTVSEPDKNKWKDSAGLFDKLSELAGKMNAGALGTIIDELKKSVG